MFEFEGNIVWSAGKNSRYFLDQFDVWRSDYLLVFALSFGCPKWTIKEHRWYRNIFVIVVGVEYMYIQILFKIKKKRIIKGVGFQREILGRESMKWLTLKIVRRILSS